MPHRPAGSVRPCPRKPPWHVTDATILTGGHHTDSAARSCQTSYLCAPPSQSLTPRSSRPDTAGAQRTSVANGNEPGGATEPYRSWPHGRTSGPVSVAHTAPGHRPPEPGQCAEAAETGASLRSAAHSGGGIGNCRRQCRNAAPRDPRLPAAACRRARSDSEPRQNSETGPCGCRNRLRRDHGDRHRP